MLVSPIFSSPAQQRIDAADQPGPAPMSLNMATYLAARTGAFGPEFLLSSEPQSVQVVHLSPPPDSHFGSALQVLGQPGREVAVQVIFQMLTGQPMPRGFESDLRSCMNETQVTESMPGASNAIINIEALKGFVERNPGHALSRPEIVVMLITFLNLEANGNERWVAFRQEVVQRHINSMGGLALLSAADVDEVLWESPMSPWSEIEEMSEEVSESNVDEEWEDVCEVVLNNSGAGVGGGAA